MDFNHFTVEQLKVLADALTQYVENFDDSGETEEEKHRLNPGLKTAESMLDDVNVRLLQKLGEDPMDPADVEPVELASE